MAQIQFVDELANVPELAFSPGMTDAEFNQIILKRVEYVQRRDRSTITAAKAKRDRRSMKLARTFPSPA
jgi:hypothetical protein